MAELARGSTTDRPWGRTLGALGLRGVTGQVILQSDGKRYQIALGDGAVTGASSPLAIDAAVRVALTAGLVSSTQAAEVARRQQQSPHRDEVELLSELIRLSPEQAMRLRRRVVAQRAARTFTPDQGDFVVVDQISLPVVPGAELDVRAVIYMGARSNLSDPRLEGELALLGSWFMIKPAVLGDLPQFGFGAAEQPVLDMLQAGATQTELERAPHGLDIRAVRAIVYALVSCNACDVDPSKAKARAPVFQPPDDAGSAAASALRGPRPSIPAPVRSAKQRITSQQPPLVRPHAPPAAPPPPSQPPMYPPAPSRDSSDGIDAPTTLRKTTPTIPGPPSRPLAPDAPTVRNPGSAAAPATPRAKGPRPDEVHSLIQVRLELLDQGADHFTLLGVPRTATADDIRTAYFVLARALHPDRLAAMQIADANRDAHRLFAQVNTAFAVLGDPTRRAEYLVMLSRGGEAAVRAEQAKADEMAMKVLDAEEAFRRGENALRRNQLGVAIEELRKAIELNPNEADYHAMLAWTQFCNSSDKTVAAPSTRSTLERAIRQAPNATTARMLLGRMERMLGRDADALRCFRDVLQIDPRHAEAQSEARVLEARLGGPKRRP